MITASRPLLLLVALFSFGAVGVALVSQYAFDMPPCAWCVMQRLIYLLIGVLALVGACMPGQGSLRRIAAGAAALLGIGGIVAAWYQHSVAALSFSCERTFADTLMVESGLEGNVSWLFGIYASCMDASVSVLGVEYAIWSLALFALLTIALITACLRRQ